MYIYLAQAYTGKEKQAVSEACKFLAQYQNDECKPAYAIYSPIVHWHYVAINHKLPTNSAFWKRENESMLRYCEELWVLLSVPGWQNSKGIRFEIETALRFCKPIRYVEYIDNKLYMFPFPPAHAYE